MPVVVGNSRTFDKKFSFVVRIDGYLNMGFMKMSGLEVEIGKITQWEGGTLIPNKSAGRPDFKDVTLERGATRLDLDSLAWFTQVLNGPRNRGLKEAQYKRNLELAQLDRDGEITKAWALYGAWPTTFVAGEWDNTVDENVIERLTISYDYFVRRL